MLGSELVGGSMIDGRLSERGSKGPSSPTPPTTLVEKYRKLGYDIETISKLSDITDNHTCYRADGPISMSGYHEIQQIRDTAVVGVTDDARLVIPEDHRQYALIIRGGRNFRWSGVDIDQRKPGAMGRMYATLKDGAVFENFEHVGPGTPKNPNPSKRAIRSGALFYIPATTESGTNTVRNWRVVFEGVFPDKHFGNRAFGFWTGASHEGTIRIVNSHIESVPNNAIYGAASPGRYEVENCTFRDNGVTCGGRFAHGEWRGCDIEFDSSETTLRNTDTTGHAVVGLASEAKKWGATGAPGPDIINCNVRMVDSPKGGTAARAYNIYQPSDFGRILDSEFHVGKGTGGWDADIEIEGRVGEISDCVFSGTNRQYASIVNTSGRHVQMKDCKWDYPEGRKKDKGPVSWR